MLEYTILNGSSFTWTSSRELRHGETEKLLEVFQYRKERRVVKLESMTLRCGDQVREIFIRPASSDASLVGQVFVDEAFDISKLARFSEIQRFLDRGRQTGKRPLIVDGGANIGLTAVYFATQCRDPVIVAIEPEPSNFALLYNNVRELPVLPVPCALAGHPGSAALVDPGDGYWAFRTSEVDASNRVEELVDCITIGEIYDSHRDRCFPFIVKIDIEGGEKDIFSGNLDWIEQTPILIVELHDWMLPRQKTALPFLQAVATLNRDFIIRGENIVSIVNDLEVFETLF